MLNQHITCNCSRKLILFLFIWFYIPPSQQLWSCRDTFFLDKLINQYYINILSLNDNRKYFTINLHGSMGPAGPGHTASTVTVSGHHWPTSKTPSNGGLMVACWAGSNSRPLDYQSDSLLIELRGLAITNFVVNYMLQADALHEMVSYRTKEI